MKINNIKKKFPIFKKKINGKNLIYLDSANSSQKPQSVINRMSYFYENEFSKWMRWQGGVNESGGWSLLTDYGTQEQVTSEVFQIKRAASTIASFSNSAEVTDFIQQSKIFSDQDKKQIIRELIFTNSSQTLESYGINLGF